MTRRLLLELALRAYPRAFRERFGDEIRADVRGRMTLRLFGRLVASGLAERRAAAARRLTWSADRRHLYEPAPAREHLWRDIRHAIRGFARMPGFTAVAVLVLAVGIAATMAVFSVVHAVLLRPLPYASPGRLVMIWSVNPADGPARRPVSPGDYRDVRERTASFSGLGYALSFLNPMLVVGQEDAGPVQLLRVSPDLPEIIGRPPALGRVFGAEDTGVAVISDRLWRRRFGADPAVIGRAITLSGDERLEIVGVMPPDFELPFGKMLGSADAFADPPADLWAPMPMEDPRWRAPGGELSRSVQMLAVFGRLRDGVDAAQADAEVGALARALEAAHPDSNRGRHAVVVPLGDQAVGELRPALLVLLAAVAVLLLMAAANVANLVLARSVSRQAEFGVRAALGATRWALVRQVLIEGFVLACAGGLAGLLLARWTLQASLARVPPDLQPIVHPRADASLVLFVVFLVAATAAAIGLVPALFAARGDVAAAVQPHARGSSASRAGRRLRSALVAVEVALAVLLATGAGLLVRSFQALLAVNPGFQYEHALTFQLNAPDRLTGPDERRAFYQGLFERLESVPGVLVAGGTTRIPLGSPQVSTRVEVEGMPPRDGRWPEVEFRRAMHQYFAAMGIPVLRGRGFAPEDATGPPAAIVNETMARQLFGSADPVGRRIRMQPAAGDWLTIVGVIGDVRHVGLDAPPPPELYVDYSRNPPVSPFLVLRTAVAPDRLVDVVRREVRAFDPAAAPYDVRTMGEVRAASVSERRFVLLLMAAFGIAALLLAAAGVYGVAAVAAAERTREIGVRIALGAPPRSVVALIVRQSTALALLGAAAGAGAAAVSAPLAASQLFGVGAHDPLTFAAVPALLVAVAALASLGPATRAARVDPLLALRQE